MSDPVEDGVRLLRAAVAPSVWYRTNDEMRDLVRNIIAPAERAARDSESHDIYQSNFVFTQEQWDAEYARITVAAVQAERKRCITIVQEHFNVAPLAAESLITKLRSQA